VRTLKPLLVAGATAILLASCGGAATDTTATTDTPFETTTAMTDTTDAVAAFRRQMASIDDTVAAWRGAATVEEAHVAAETAANLVVGPNGPGYGDRNGDGTVSGETTAGILPGIDGTPAGLAAPLSDNACVAGDVLGGSWTDPGAAWDAMAAAIADWRTDNNTMPTLASHPMRIVGWATFTLASDSLDAAHEYSGHAKLHVDVALRALDC
jgi:hypothetical protein